MVIFDSYVNVYWRVQITWEKAPEKAPAHPSNLSAPTDPNYFEFNGILMGFPWLIMVNHG
jgi:hypothetical protein